MRNVKSILIVLCACAAILLPAQNVGLDEVLEDIYNQLSEDGNASWEELQEELMEIAANPIDLNHTTADELSRLPFLSDEQIDAILMYQYQHRFEALYELQLISCFKDYEIRNLLPFVRIESSDGQGDRSFGYKKLYFREVFHLAKHEMTLRIDARNIEDYEGDPMYGKFRYRFNYHNRVQAGVTLDRATGVSWEKVNYGGYIQLKDIGPMKTIVAGNYQASFGYGLVVGSPFKRGKTSYIQSTEITDEGLKKYSSVGDSYAYFHGIGTTARVGWADVSAFYSLRDEDEAWQHAIGVNATGRWGRLKVGVTGFETIGRENVGGMVKGKIVMGVNARYNWGKVDVWGEVATSQEEKWGLGTIAGVRYRPVSELNLLAIYRYYSPEYVNPYANVLCSKTRISDEHGGYVGVEYNRLKNWDLSAFVDVWKGGYELIAQSEYLPRLDYRMFIRFRAKQKDELDTYALRWNSVWQLGNWRLKTQVDGNLVVSQSGLSYGWSVLQDVEYRLTNIPIVLQLRAQAFDARAWNNRVYIYENDVLYAYAMPFVYGLGGRFWLNARYKINDTFSLYLRVSETIYQSRWAADHDKESTRTDIHALLRVKL